MFLVIRLVISAYYSVISQNFKKTPLHTADENNLPKPNRTGPQSQENRSGYMQYFKTGITIIKP